MQPSLLLGLGFMTRGMGTETATRLEVLIEGLGHNSYVGRADPRPDPWYLCGLYSVRGATRANDNAQVV